MTTLTEKTTVNGINLVALRETVEAVKKDPAKGMTQWHVTSHWRGGTRSDTHVKSYSVGGEKILKNFTIKIDEPLELCGTNQFANPQEYLFAALNACLIVGYSAVCAHEGDLRGFLNLDPTVKPGYDELRYTVHIKGNATPEQFEKIHRMVMTTSPNYFNLTTAVPLKSRLVVK
jgi:hypothetical protein